MSERNVTVETWPYRAVFEDEVCVRLEKNYSKDGYSPAAWYPVNVVVFNPAVLALLSGIYATAAMSGRREHTG